MTTDTPGGTNIEGEGLFGEEAGRVASETVGPVLVVRNEDEAADEGTETAESGDEPGSA